MCWLTKAWPSTTSVMVFFRSAPTARIGRSTGRRRDGAGSIAADAAQNHGAKGAGTCHGIVHATRDGALADEKCVGNAAESVERIFVLDKRSVRSTGWRWSSPARPERPRRTAGDAAGCKAASRRVRRCREPRIRQILPRGCQHDGARDGGEQRFALRARVPPDSRATSRSRAITANGFSLRNLRSRRARTAAALRASQARW